MISAPVAGVFMVLVFAGASFFFALAETTLFSLGKWQVTQLAERQPRAGGIVARLLAAPQDLLATMVLGNTGALAGMILIAFWLSLRQQWPLLGILGLLLIVSLFGCEVLPKTMAVRAPERWALRIARPMLVVERLSAPLRFVGQRLSEVVLKTMVPTSVKPQTALTDADYQELLEMACQQGTLAESEKDIILQIISLDRRTVKDVMKPRTRMAAISDDLSIEEMIAAARRHRHRRLPIYDEEADTIVGVLNTRALLLDPQIDLADAIEFPSFVPESMNLLQLFKSLQRQQRGLAIVLDEFGGTAGIVTLGDILEEMVGRMHRDQEATGFLMERLSPGRWRVSGTMRVDDFRREYTGLGDVPDVDTMGGLLVFLLDVVPAPGESAAFRGLKLTAHVTEERRVKELIVEVAR